MGKGMGGKIIFSHGESNARGICVLVKHDFKGEIKNVYSEQGGIIVFDMIDTGIEYTCVGLYAPNKDTPEFFRTIEHEIECRSENRIIMGDFNLVLNESMDRSCNSNNNNKKAAIVVHELMSQHQLIDIWRIRNPQTREYTWHKGGNNMHENLRASRIDLALVSKGLDQMIKTVMFLPGIRTDHRAVLITVTDCRKARGVGYWKFNNTLLEDKTFLKRIKHEIKSTCDSMKHADPKTRWERIKKRIKYSTTQYSRIKAGHNELIIGQLAEKINEYESRMPLTESESKMYHDTKLDFDEKNFERAKGLIFRSKAR